MCGRPSKEIIVASDAELKPTLNGRIELNGTVTVRKVWDGRANLEEIEAGNATAHFKGLTLFLYNPQSHQWSQSFANINNGALNQPPLIGEFKDGRGELFDQELEIVVTRESHNFAIRIGGAHAQRRR